MIEIHAIVSTADYATQYLTNSCSRMLRDTKGCAERF